jgi:aspartyl-tRNA(Asn)/glutamyl-tRNA(Gln) amidotransferase subunit B
MEEGSMRCDANISVRLKGEKKLGTRVEVKNLNSIRNVKRAIEHEIDRLIDLAENGETIVQETRSFDAENGTTFSLRTKEEADDYRYFPEPDLCPFFISEDRLHQIQSELPRLPQQLEKKYCMEYNLSPYDATVICDDREQMLFFEKIIEHTNNYKAAANWILGPVKNYLNENQIAITECKVSPANIALMIRLVDDGKVNFNVAATKIFAALLLDSTKTPLQIATELNLIQESDSNSIRIWVDEAIKKMPDKVKEYQSGKKGLIGLFAGEVKRISKGKADMQLVNKLLAEKLQSK